MAVSYVGVSSGADSSGATLTVGMPGGVAPTAGDLIVALVAFWNSTRTPPILDETAISSGWQTCGDTTGTDGGGGTYGLDLGPRDVAAYWKVSDGTETSVAFDLPSDTGQGVRGYTETFAKSLAGWATPISIAGSDATDGTAFSATPAADFSGGCANGDMLAVGVVNRPDTATQGSPAITYATGSYTQRASGAATAGHDARHNVGTFAVTGASSGAPTFTATLSAAGTGAVLFVRVRESAAVSASTSGKAGSARGRVVAGSVTAEQAIDGGPVPGARASAPLGASAIASPVVGTPAAARARAAAGVASGGAAAPAAPADAVLADGLYVYVAFDAGVSGTPTWTDVTNRVRVNPGVDIHHWRRDERSTCDRSSCDLTLRNDNGDFTPGNTSSAFYPNIKKGRRIRVVTVRNGEEFPRYTGYINDYKAEWPATVGDISDCRVTASSRMAHLGSGTELRALVEEMALLDGPSAHYPLSEPTGATEARDISGTTAANLTQHGGGTAVTFGGGIGPGTVGALFAGGKYLTGVGLDGLHFDFWFATSATGLQALVMSDGGLGIVISGTNRLGFQNGLLGVTNLSAGTVNDGAVHHVAWNATTGEVWLDSASVGFAPATLTAGRYIGGDPSGLAATLTGSMSQVAFYPSALSADQIALHASAGLNGFEGAASGTMAALYASLAGVPASDLEFDAGQVADLAAIDTTGRTALDVMREVESTEGGVLFDALDGTLTFHDRRHRYEAAAFGTLLFGGGFFGGGPDGTEFTLSYTAGHIANPIVPVLDDQRQVNDMTNTNADGVTGRQTDQDSIDDHGLYRDGLSLATTDPDEPLLRASWTVGRYAEPLTRVSEVEVNVNALPDDLAAVVLRAQVGTIFTLADMPPNAPAEKMHLFVEGRSDRITADEDRIIFRTSPAEVYEVFTLGDPVRGVIGSDYPLAY